MREIFAIINIERDNSTEKVRVYKLKEEKYGIEIERLKEDQTVISKVENMTKSNEKINKLLNEIIDSIQNFTLLKDIAYDFADDEDSIT